MYFAFKNKKGDGILDDIEDELNKVALAFSNDSLVAVRKLSMISTRPEATPFIEKYGTFASPFFILLK